MTTRHLNFTGRKRIHRRDVEIGTVTDERSLSFQALYSFSDYSLPETAEIVVEAYVGWTVMRFEFGTLGTRIEPDSYELSDFDGPEGLLFRLKVLGTGDQTGLILAQADNLRASAADELEKSQSFVVVRPADLGSVAWRLVFDEAQPVLQVNERVGDWKSFLRHSAVRSLLLPEIVRQLLREALQTQPDDEDSDAWQNHAQKLASSAAGTPPATDDYDEVESWIDDVVRSFAHRHRLWRGVREFLKGDTN